MVHDEIFEIADEAGARALENPEFRKKLIDDGNKAIKEEFGKDLPIKITFHESDDKNLIFVLPANNNELSDNMLNEVSGGTGFASRLINGNFPVSGYGCFPNTLSSELTKKITKQQK